MKHTSFRGWVHNLWLENCEERLLYNGGNRLDEREYFRQFKWWLRREWRHQQKIQAKKESRSGYLWLPKVDQ